MSNSLCQTCGVIALPDTITRNHGICELCKKRGYTIYDAKNKIKNAIYSNVYEFVHSLIESDKSLIKKDIDGVWLPIHFAAQYNKENSISAILDQGGDVEELNWGNLGHSPLYIAASNGSYPAVEVLIKRGANVNFGEDFYLKTPLHVAAMFGYDKIIRALISANANLDLLDHEGRKPIDLARENGKADLFSRILNEFK